MSAMSVTTRGSSKAVVRFVQSTSLLGVLARHAEHVADHHRGDVDADVLDEVEAAVRVARSSARS